MGTLVSKTARFALCANLLMLASLCLAQSAHVASSQSPASSDQAVSDVLKMKHAGLSDELVIQHFKSDGKAYSFTTDQLMRMKSAGIHDAVMVAMMSTSGAAGAAAEAPAPEAVTAAPMPTEMGVYQVKQGQYSEVLPEIVNFKTGGSIKAVATVGVVKGDMNGHVQGPASRNRFATPLELLVVMREGDAITEYQLLRMRQHGDNREFRTVTGGVFHSSGGATRDAIAFDTKKVANRTYLITIPKSLGIGEFGMLPPSSADTHSNAGKIYAFGVTE